jgi:hypothetical protein
MQDAEFVVRFLTLFELWRTFKGDLRESMDKFMERHQRAPLDELTNFEDSFLRAISRCEGYWGTHAFHRVDRGSWRDQALAGMYDAQMIAAANLGEPKAEVLSGRRTEIVASTRQLFADSQFETAVRVGTNTPRSVRLRVTAVMNLLESITG